MSIPGKANAYSVKVKDDLAPFNENFVSDKEKFIKSNENFRIFQSTRFSAYVCRFHLFAVRNIS